MGMGPYLYPGSLEAGKVRGPQHVGRREHTSLISLAEGTRRHVEGAWQLPFGEGRHRVAGEVSEAVIRRDQDRADRERPVPAQAVGELRDGDRLQAAGYHHVKVSAEGGGADGERRDPVGRIGGHGMVQEDGDRVHDDLPPFMASSVSAAAEHIKISTTSTTAGRRMWLMAVASAVSSARLRPRASTSTPRSRTSRIGSRRTTATPGPTSTKAKTATARITLCPATAVMMRTTQPAAAGVKAMARRRRSADGIIAPPIGHATCPVARSRRSHSGTRLGIFPMRAGHGSAGSTRQPATPLSCLFPLPDLW